MIAILFCVGLSFGLMGFSLDTPTVIAAAGIFGVLWVYIQWQSVRVTVLSERGAFLGQRQTSLDDVGIREQSANHTFLTTWDGVLGVEETPAHVFMMIDRCAGYVVPKRAFANSAQLGEFLAFARAHAGGSGRSTPTGSGTSSTGPGTRATGSGTS